MRGAVSLVRRWPNLFTAALAIAFIGWVGWQVRAAKRAAGESACHGQIFKLAQAVRVYELGNKTLPSSSNGNPPHSWRILVLPELGYDTLYAQYRFDEPWDSQANRKILTQMPHIFTCHNSESTNCTSYFLHVDEAGRFSVFERNGVDIPWTKPEDVSPNAPTGPASDPNGFGIAVPTDSGDPLVTFRREAK
jgi:hypothetical protein